ncbi:conserved repeat protein [Methanobrevibacter smithii DSM 2375]|uniref:Conserved repeat protein n=1 Tax=Methanobrevibacter smithii DSM 2375 TaxID=483214 RepID=B9AH22_METSM|nr:DUF11 domain-containing protein [Methanobrevibacter smithii]EEE42762.1 conserved repeat protein [Methanobrevibacter smithii DSM 2375]
MFKNKQKHFLISVLLMILFLAASGTAFSADLNETSEVPEVSVCKDNLENSQNDVVGSSEITLNGGKFSDIQKAIDNVGDGGTIHLNGYYSAQNNDSVIYVNKNIRIAGGLDTVLDGKNISCIFSIQKTGSNCQISNLKFVNGMDVHGGAMIILGKNVVVENSVFENNYANHSGGAIYVLSIFNDSGRYPEEGENLIIKNCNFTNNFAQVAAGAIGVYGNNTQVIGCNFVSNKVKPATNHKSYGGAIQIGRDEYNLCSYVVNCNFMGNEAIAHDLNNSHGGAGCVRAGITYQNCKFINNSADQGGALTYHASGIIEDCVFINNSAKLYGGALSTGYMDMDMDLKVINCNFEQNNAPYGGAVQLKGKNIEIQNSVFNKNTAAVNGGAINIVAKTVAIGGTEFNKNTAHVNGGAIYINGNKTVIEDSSFMANEAIPDVKKLDDGLGGAIYINSSSATINKNIFNNNVARNGSAIYYDKSGLNCIISDNAMAENQAWVYALPIYAKSIYYGEDCEVSATLFGGNNIAKYNDLFVSNAIYNNAKQDKIKVNGETPILGAVDNGKLYQDSREYNMDILLTVTHEDGSVAFNKTLKSDFKGQVSNILKNLKPGRYKISATHFEDTYYKYIANVTYFSVFPKADLQLNKSSNLINANYGDIVIWTLKITNNGPNVGTGIRLKDLIPDGLIILSCDDENYNKKTGILNIDSLNMGESKIINIKTLVNKTGTFINEASVSGNEYDWDLKNNNDSAGINVNPSADLAVKILVNDTNPKFNSLVKWTLRVTNNGPDEATGVVVCDLLSKDLIYLSSTGNYDVKSGLWNIETLESGKSVSIDIVTLVNKTGKIANDASVSGKEYDWNLSNNYDNKSIAVDVCADLAIKKLVNDTNPKFNSLVEWTLRVTNNGPDTATGVFVCDILPEGLISIDKSFNGTWNVGKLLNNQTKELTIICLVNKTGKLVNIADIAGNEYDCNLTNNIVNKSIEVAQSADLFVKKYVNNTSPDFGEIIKWSVVVSNNGPDIATNVQVNDLLDDGLIFVKSSSTKGNYDVKLGIWTIDSLAPETDETLNIYCKVNKIGKILNFVSVNSTQYDWNESNNHDNESVNAVKIADLSVIKLINNSNPNYNDLIKWTIIVSNKGPNMATGVIVNDLLPKSVEYISSYLSKGFYNPVNGIWDVGNLNAGEKLQLNIVSKIVKTGDITNVVNVKGNEKDSNLTNNHFEKSVHVKPAADLSIEKSVSKQEVNINDLIEYVIEITNNGPDSAENIKVSELLNPNLKVISFESTKGNFNNTNNVLTIDSLVNGEKVRLTINAAANACGKFENKVAVSSDTFDYDKSNNQDGTSVFVSENTTEKIENPVNDTYLLVLAKNSLQKSMVSKLENLTHPQSLTSIELPKTGLPIVLLLLVSMISIGFLPIKISKKR